MARHYSPKNFLRQAPNALLSRYCQEKHVLAEVDFTALSETGLVLERRHFGQFLASPPVTSGEVIGLHEQEG